MIDRRAGRTLCSASALVALALVTAGSLWGDDDVALTALPTDATSEEIARHVLDEAKAPWQRLSPVQVLSPEGLAEVDAHLAAAAEGYEVVTCATTRFRLAEDGEVQVTLLGMCSALDALGVFAADRPDSPQRVALASPAYWHEGALRLFAGRRYLELRPDRDDEGGLAISQQLALQLEMRFPPPERRPRIMSVMPRRYLNPYLLRWGLVDICGDGHAQKTLVGTREVGDRPLTISVIECADAMEARETCTRFLNVALQEGRALELSGVGEEGFAGSGSDGLVCAAMWQDEFVAVATGDVSSADAEAMLRIVGMRIRTTRPLPQITSGD